MAKTRQRRMRGTGSITRRKSGLWVGRVVYDGHSHQVTSMDRAELLTKLEQAKADLKEMGYLADKTITVQAWTERWLADFMDSRRAKTWTSYASLLRGHVQPVIGTKPLAKVTPADVRSVAKRITASGLSSTTAARCYRVLSMCLEDARREKLVGENVCTRVDAPSEATVERGSFTVDQTRAILKAAAESPDGSRHIIALLTGTRQSERLGLTLDALHLDEGYLTVDWQLQELQSQHGCGPRLPTGLYPCGFKQGARCPTRSWRVPPATAYRVLEGRMALVDPKSKNGVRSVPLIPPAVAALRMHLEATAGQPNPHGLVWHRDGHPIDRHDDGDSWRALITSVGLPASATTHWARHSVATLLMEAGVDAHVVGEIVGHGSVAVTRGYQHVSSALAREAMGRLAALLA